MWLTSGVNVDNGDWNTICEIGRWCCSMVIGIGMVIGMVIGIGITIGVGTGIGKEFEEELE
jgi:hypothetical protein